MKYRVNGGLIGSAISTSISSASGVWAQPEIGIKRGDNIWPIIVKDPYFNLTNILLKGDGTNTANNNTINESSPNAYTATLPAGKATQGSYSPYGQISWSNYFNGSGALSVADSASLRFGTGAFTVECWLYPTTAGIIQTIVDKGNGSSVSGWLFRMNASNQLEFLDVSAAKTSTLVPVQNYWNHVVVIRDASGNINIGLNGTLQNVATGVTRAYTQTDPVYIGVGRGGSANPFTGYISNLRFLTNAVKYSGSSYTIPTSPFDPTESNTVLLTCQGNRFYDAALNGAVTVTNAPVIVQPFNPFAPSSSYNVTNNVGSLYFSGADQVTFTGGTNFNLPADFTIECWCYATVVADGYCLFNLKVGSYTILLRFIGTSWQFFPGTVTISTDTPLNKWQHVAVVRSGTTLTVYLDGVSVYSVTNGTNFTTTTLDLGNYASLYWNGYISNFRIVKGTAVYTGNFTPPTTPVTAISGTQVLINGTNSGVYDSAMKADLLTNGTYLSTTQSKFGGSSIYFPGGTSSLYTVPIGSTTIPQSGALGAGDFTVEMWTYFTGVAVGTFQCIATSRYGTTYPGTWFLGLYSGALSLVFYDGASGLGQTSMNLPQNQWAHVAAVRYNNVIKVYINGALGLTTATNTTNYNVSELSFGFDRGEGAYPWTGYMDDIRITRGVARYTAAFTPPSSVPIQ